jgi:hypothetical protein
MLKCIASCDIVTISKELYETHIKKASIFVVIKKRKESLNAPDFAFLLVHSTEYTLQPRSPFFIWTKIFWCAGGELLATKLVEMMVVDRSLKPHYILESASRLHRLAIDWQVGGAVKKCIWWLGGGGGSVLRKICRSNGDSLLPKNYLSFIR